MILYCVHYTSNITGAKKVMLATIITHLFNMLNSDNYRDIEVSLRKENDVERIHYLKNHGTYFINKALL